MCLCAYVFLCVYEAICWGTDPVTCKYVHSGNSASSGLGEG